MKKAILVFLALLVGLVGLAFFQFPDSNLHIVACDVGQGDAILITYKKVQILTDGGPNNKVLGCLARHMPFWDRKIELVISTHPDADHSTGLIEVVKRYQISTLLANNLDVSTQVWQALKKEAGRRGIKVVYPREGMKLRLGLIYLEILHPKEQFSILNFQFSKAKTNEYSVVYLLKYGQFEALMTGDINQVISDQLSANSKIGPVEYIKVPHHGSKNGLSEALLAATMPRIAVISVGKNSYGHPHEDVLDMLARYGLLVLRTDERGDVEVVTDGGKYWLSKGP